MATVLKETVILVHGLWMQGWVMAVLGRRLRQSGFRVVTLSYPTLRNTVGENAFRLQELVNSLPGDKLHFVGHSLGGLVILQLFHDFPNQRPGRIILLGTPCTGSQAACTLASNTVGRRLLGQSLENCLRGNGPQWAGGWDLGVIAGNLPLGGGLLLRLSRPHDGAVAVRETRIPNMTAHITLPVSHTGLVLSNKVAQRTDAFLKTGQFGGRP